MAHRNGKDKKEFLTHADCIKQLGEAQDADQDQRQQAREAKLFVNKEDGQWEPDILHSHDQAKKPRYTFDMTTPVLRQVIGGVNKRAYSIKVSPAGGEGSKESAETYEGLLRNIQEISNAKQIYKASTKSTVTAGFAGWRIVHEYTIGKTFDQDLLIKPIRNAEDRLWFGASEEQDRSDSKIAWVLSSFTPAEYKAKWKNGSAQGVGDDRISNAYTDKRASIMVGECYTIQETQTELVFMSNGATYEVNDDFDKIKDELKGVGITETRRRKRPKFRVYIRTFDGKEWLDDDKLTVFEEWIPLIPMYANFDIVEDKIVWSGEVRRLMDPQRVFNYTKSREVAEGALSPRSKYWATEAQVLGHEDKLSTMNTNNDPVQLYNADPETPGAPQQQAGAQINPGLQVIGQDMKALISETAGQFAANRGENPGLQSGVAIDALKDTGDTINEEYINSREIAQCHTARIIINAIPRVYKPDRQVRLLKEDGQMDMVTIGQQVQDQQTGQLIILHNLDQGTYDVVCTSGPSFKNRQSETVAAILEIGQVDPTVIEQSGDILTKNISAPGMDQVSERRRASLLQQGVIPESQWTDEEKQQAEQLRQQQAQQGQQPDPQMIAAQALEKEAQVAEIEAQTKQGVAQSKAQNEQMKLQIEQFNLQIKQEEAAIKRFEAETKRIEALEKLEPAKAKAFAEIMEKQAKTRKLEAETENLQMDGTVRLDNALNGGTSHNSDHPSELN